MQYTLFNNGTDANITVFINGEMLSATNQHPSWTKIVAGAVSGDESIAKLFDPGATAAEHFEKLSDRVSIAGGQIYFDGDAVDGALADQILRFIEDDVEDWQPLVNFYEKVMTNFEAHTREQLFRWLQKQQITITEDGDFLAYKGVQTITENGETKYVSVNHGKAIVDGVVHNGAIPNYLGAVVSMPRSEVQHDPGVGCASGLHAGTWKYASGWARGATLRVKINPRNVVSVPTDCDFAKLRVSEYEVVDVTEQENLEAVYQTHGDRAYDSYHEDEDTWGDNEWDDED
jgi:hypothetical protein